VSAPPSTVTVSSDALDALRALRSVTQSGISYRDYSQRVLDAKVKVDQYLSSPANDAPALRSAITLGMREFLLASQAWSIKFSDSADPGRTLELARAVGRTLEQDPQISQCPVTRQFIDQTYQTAASSKFLRKAKEQESPEARTQFIGFLASSRPDLLWPCASAQVAEAERLLAQPPAPLNTAGPALQVVPEKTAESLNVIVVKPLGK
jgi:hypothetical protein